MKRAIVYVDGFNLYYGIRSLDNPVLKWLNIECFVKSFLDSDTCLEQVKYFTSMITGDADTIARQKLYIQVLELQSTKLSIIKGHFLKKGEIVITATILFKCLRKRKPMLILLVKC